MVSEVREVGTRGSRRGVGAIAIRLRSGRQYPQVVVNRARQLRDATCQMLWFTFSSRR